MQRRRPPSRVFFLLSALSSLAVAACSLFFDDDGLSSLPPPFVDGSIESGSVDAGADGELGDGGNTSPGDSGGCDATFCDDFGQEPVGGRWSATTVMPGGNLELGTPARSAPTALRARIFDVATPNPRALLQKTLGMGTRVSCELNVYAAVLPTTDFVDFFGFQTKTADFSYYLWLGTSGTAGTFRDDFARTDGGCDCPLTAKPAPVLPAAKWVRVRVETDFTTASLSYDGSVVYSGPFGPFTPTGPIDVVVGVSGYASQATEILIDDVTCNLSP